MTFFFGRLLSVCTTTAALALCAVAAPCRETRLLPINPFGVAGSLTELGSRETGSEANAEAAKILATRIDIPWKGTQVQGPPSDGPYSTLSGRASGKTDSEIVITAHFDSVAGSPGALDDASGCGVVMGSYWDLAASPRYRALRAIFFDGEESDRAGSVDWLESRSEEGRRSMSAAISVEMVGSPTASVGVIHPSVAQQDGRWMVTPVWLVYAAVEGAKATRFPVAVSDPKWPIFAQLSLRFSKPTRTSDSQSFLEVGIPALTISDVSLTEGDSYRHSDRDSLDRIDSDRLRRWVSTLSAMILQVDHARGSPLADTEYLVAAGRVWIRRDLLWIGLLLWVPLVFQGLPGRWRGASTDSKRNRGRKYLPGFAFRMLFLVNLVLIPTIATVLLYPVALLALIPTSRRSKVHALITGLAFLPLLSFAIWIATAQLGGHLVLHPGAIFPTVLVLLTFASFWIWRVDDP